MPDLTVEHRKLIEEENIDVNALPKEIRAKIRGFNLNLTNYVKNPTEAKQKVVIKTDVEIADSIQDWIDKGKGELEELDADDDNTGKLTPPPPPEPPVPPTPPVPPEPVPPVPPTPPEPPVPPTPPTPPEPEVDPIEKSVRAKLVNNALSVGDLRIILGREPNFPEQKAGTITLRKRYQVDEYFVK